MKKLYPLLILSLVFFISACGGGGSDEAQTESSENDAQTTQSADDVRTIDIIGIDKMKYVVEEEGEMIGTAGTVETAQGESFILLESIDAKPGEELRIRLTTKSQLPGQAMSHNYVQLKQNADVDAFNQAAIKAKDNEYIPSDMSDQIIAHTGLAAQGETVEVTFTVPQESGEYPYLCSFPAHFAAGMKGMLNVQ